LRSERKKSLDRKEREGNPLNAANKIESSKIICFADFGIPAKISKSTPGAGMQATLALE